MVCSLGTPPARPSRRLSAYEAPARRNDRMPQSQQQTPNRAPGAETVEQRLESNPPLIAYGDAGATILAVSDGTGSSAAGVSAIARKIGASAYGVLGTAMGNDGVQGRSNAAGCSGVAGIHESTGNGVYGRSAQGSGPPGRPRLRRALRRREAIRSNREVSFRSTATVRFTKASLATTRRSLASSRERDVTGRRSCSTRPNPRTEYARRSRSLARCIVRPTPATRRSPLVIRSRPPQRAGPRCVPPTRRERRARSSGRHCKRFRTGKG